MSSGRTPSRTTVPFSRHEPDGYACPFCRLLSGLPDLDLDLDERDIVHRNARATAFMSPKWWPRNHGNVLVVPDQHVENLYEIAAEDHHAVHDAVQAVARAMRASYGCDGVSTRQHNEPAGSQDVWHLHVHVFPRYAGDTLYQSSPEPALATQAQREPHRRLLVEALGQEG